MSEIFNLDKELARSRIYINLNEINDLNNAERFLVSRTWDCLDDNKIMDLDGKVESIYALLNKENIKKLKDDIEKSSFDTFFQDYDPMINDHRIGCLSSLNCLVESTYFHEGITEEKKTKELNELTPLVFKYRYIKGDGECFYRALIFSLLENIILTNNIMQMKELLILYHEKINKNNELINKKEYLQRINLMNISIVEEILYILISQMEINCSKAYEILLKVFLFSEDFDFGIIFFTRYLIYEYISANEDKIYTKEYQVEVGCLLPKKYIIDRGNRNEYLFENFYSLELMNPKTFAEKIVIYMIPFVFNVNMNILLYDYGLNGAKSEIIENRFFNENKANYKNEVNLLFRKIHYDVYYKFQFLEEHRERLNIFVNLYEYSDNFIPNMYKEYENNEQKFNSITNNFNAKEKENNKEKNESKIFKEYNKENKENNIDNELGKLKENDKENNENKKMNNNENNINNNIKNIIKDINKELINRRDNDIYGINANNYINFLENNNQQNNENILPTCLECKKPYRNKENVFGLCTDCLLSNIKSLLLALFLDFMKDAENLVNSREKFDIIIKKKIYKISVQENISLFEAINNSDLKFKDLFLSIRSNLCIFHGKNINDKFKAYIDLPCKCKICSKDCFIKYMDIMKQFIMLNANCDIKYLKFINSFSCFCGFIYSTNNILDMIKEMMKKELEEQKNIYQDYIFNIWNWKCCFCRKNFSVDEKFCRMIFSSDNIDRNLLNNKTEFKHLLCQNCYEGYNIKSKVNNIIDCNMCELKHKIIGFFKVNMYNEDEFHIFE